MKNRILSLIILSLCSLNLIGCKDISIPVKNQNNNDIVDTKEKYMVDDDEYDVYYDIHTNIVYLHINNQSGYRNIIPLIGSDKLPMTLDEYNQTK